MTFSDLISLWPNLTQFARDIGVTVDLASKWRRERGIPSYHWPAVLGSAKKRKIKLTADDLMNAERLRKEDRAA